MNIKRYLPTLIWYYCPRLRYDLPATCFRLFLLLRRKRFLSTLLDPRLPYPDSYMLRLPFDLLLSPTQFSSLSAVRMLAYNLYQPFILEVVLILMLMARRCGLDKLHPLSAAYASLSLSRLRRQAAPSCELPAPPVWCALCYIYMHQSCCNGELSAS